MSQNEDHLVADFESVQKAYNRIRQLIYKTPVLQNKEIDAISNLNLYFKCENFQIGGAFKIRGALNSVLCSQKKELEKGIVTHSSGNHGIAVAIAGQMVGVKTTIVLPQNTTQVKVDIIKSKDAKIEFCENTQADRLKVCDNLIQSQGYKLIHPFNQKETICGQGSIAIELLDQVPYLDAIVVPISGGGLISGISIAAKAIKNDIQIFAAEPCGRNNQADAYQSKSSGQIVNLFTDTIAEGLRANLGDQTFPVVKKLVDKVLVVSEHEIISSMKILYKQLKIVVEASGAVSLAAVHTQHFQNVAKEMGLKNVGVVISGGNIDLDKIMMWESLTKC